MKPAHIGSPIPGVTNCMFGGSPHCARSFRRAWIQILKGSIYLLDHAEGGQMLCSLAVYPFFISLPLTQIIPGGTNVKADTSVRALTILPIKRQKENSFFCVAVCKVFFSINRATTFVCTRFVLCFSRNRATNYFLSSPHYASTTFGDVFVYARATNQHEWCRAYARGSRAFQEHPINIKAR